MRSKIGVLTIGFLAAGLMACTTLPKRDTRVPRVPTAGEIAIEKCYPLLAELTPYRHTGVKFYVDKVGDTDRSIYVEKMVREKHRMTTLPPYVLVPFTEVEFQQYVKARATIWRSEDVQYTRYGDKSTYVTIATIVQAKIPRRSDHVIRIEDAFLAQIIRDGNLCGVWEVKPK